jgi:hypothetical protein
MTADTAVKLRCDGRDASKPAGDQMCREQVADGSYGERTPGLPASTYIWTKTDARREARKLGWATGVHHDGSRGGQFDYCPDCKPAKTAAGAS